MSRKIALPLLVVFFLGQMRFFEGIAMTGLKYSPSSSPDQTIRN